VPDSRNVLLKYTAPGGKKEGDLVVPMDESQIKTIPVNRKTRNNLKKIEENYNSQSSRKEEHEEVPIMPAVKYKTGDKVKTSSEDISQLVSNLNIVNKEDEVSDDEEDSDEVKYAGFLYKITQTKKLKKLFFKLVHRDLYYYKKAEDLVHKGMHNLSGVFVQEEKPICYDNVNLFVFSVIYPKKSRFYYVDNEKEFHEWVYNLRKATGYQNLTDIYDVKEKLGNGKFGLVRLGIHKETYRRVAVKIMNKREMSNQDLELVKTEIDILKICQHPNIIRLFDIFENNEFIYIIMEFCSGGDLFSYIEKRGFRLSEPRAAELIHKLSAAVYYLHSYGITHRDLKPENILMTDNTDDADMRLLDFGLSKIIGPGETCIEPFGTLVCIIYIYNFIVVCSSGSIVRKTLFETC
jgi:hypothetical protein